MKRIILMLTLCLGIVSLSAQIDQYVIGSIGGELSNNDYELIHSLGEVAGTYIGGERKLEQGFPHCADCGDCVVTSLKGLHKSFLTVRPNPTSGLLWLEGPERYRSRYQLWSVDGRQLAGGTLSQPMIDLQALPPGVYLLQVYGLQDELTLITRVMKQ